MNSVKQLWDMQQLVNQQAEKQRCLKDNVLQKEINSLKNQMTAGIEVFKKKKEDYKQLKLEITGIEEQISALSDKINHLNGKLNAGNPSHKEMAVVYAEVQALQQKIAKLEADEIVLIEQQEKMRTELELQSAELKGKKALYEQMKVDYQSFKQDLQQQIKALLSDKEKLVATIAADLMLAYQELQKRYLNPVAVVKNGVCSGCHLSLNVSQKKHVNSQQGIIRCDNCGRLIFVNDEANN